jgi:glycosyltransferase involved in cell wall biosynthesis
VTWADLLLLALWVIGAAIACGCVWYTGHGIGRTVTTDSTERVVIILPIRGETRNLPALWQGLLRQAYPYWRIIFAVENQRDPAYEAIMRLLSDRGRAEIVVAGFAADTGQKVHNQLAALGRLRPDDAIIVFADADIIPEPDWLVRIVRGLASPGVGVVSGYRWLIPTNRSLASLFIAAGNQSVATLPRPRHLNHAWGGTMAVKRATLEEIGAERIWRGSALDDLPLSAAARALGKTVLGPRELLLPTDIAYRWQDGIAFARRQYLFVRLYQRDLWLFAALATSVVTLGWCEALRWIEHPVALGAIGIVIALDQIRASFRRRVVRAMWGQDMLDRLSAVMWLDRWGTPLWMAFHCAIIWSTLFGRTIRWAGRTYRVDGRQSIRIIEAPEEAGSQERALEA